MQQSEKLKANDDKEMKKLVMVMNKSNRRTNGASERTNERTIGQAVRDGQATTPTPTQPNHRRVICALLY